MVLARSAGIPPVRHDLKTWPESFASILSGFKKQEIRVNDRDFREGDELYFREWNPVTPTGCADGGRMGMSPGGNTSGTLTLTTCRARPRSLKATGQSTAWKSEKTAWIMGGAA